MSASLTPVAPQMTLRIVPRSRKAKEGCEISDSMRLAAFKRFLRTLPPAPALPETLAYRGFEITGRKSRWFIEGSDPRVFKSRSAAEEAVDACLALREELARG